MKRDFSKEDMQMAYRYVKKRANITNHQGMQIKTMRCYLYLLFAIVFVIVAKSGPTLCDPMDYTVHGILQARILEWVAFPFSRGSSQPRG